MIRLRPVRYEDADVLESVNDPEMAGPYGWFGFRPPGWIRQRIDDGEMLSEKGGTLAVVDEDDTVLGDVSWFRMDNAPPPNGWCWNIGIWLRPEARGKGYGTAAQRQLVEHLFATTTFERIEASTDSENVAEQRALERIGFSREGVLRRAAFRDGGYHDMVLYSILRDEL